MPAGSDPVSVAAASGDATVIAEGDHLDGTLRSAQGVLVLGSFSGAIESESWVRMGEGSTVMADVTAQEVVVAGRYEGRMVATSRLEIAATGHLRGDIHAPRLLLHEGGIIDGTLVMTPGAEVERARQRGAAADVATRAADRRPRPRPGPSPSPSATPARAPRRRTDVGDDRDRRASPVRDPDRPWSRRGRRRSRPLAERRAAPRSVRLGRPAGPSARARCRGPAAGSRRGSPTRPSRGAAPSR